MKTLSLYNFSATENPPSLFHQLAAEGHFVMKTCQRNLVLAIDEFRADAHLQGIEAYTFMLEMLCGLKSRLLAENEIVSQFKQSLQQFHQHKHRKKKLTPVLQKLLQDSKTIRTEHLLGLGQRTYASITQKIVKRYAPQYDEVLIYGSGQLSQDLVQYFCKTHQVFVTARNPEKIEQLQGQYDIKPVSWKEKTRYLQFDIHLNTIGTETRIFGSGFTQTLHSEDNLIVDLAQPSPFYELGNDKYFGLRDIYDLGVIAEEKKLKQIKSARTAIRQKATDRLDWFYQQEQRRLQFLQGQNDNLYHRHPGQFACTSSS